MVIFKETRFIIDLDMVSEMTEVLQIVLALKSPEMDGKW